MTQGEPHAFTDEEIEAGKGMAILAWVSMFAGFPIFLLPMVQRDNAYALYHAKHAATTYIGSMVLAVVFVFVYFVTCGLGVFLMPVLFLTLVPTIDGLIKAMNGRAEPPMVIGGLTDSVFGGLQANPKVETAPKPPSTDADES